MNILVCGDLHAKIPILDQVKIRAKEYDKVIFLGDYVDDWGAIPEANYNLLNSLVEWKKAEPRKVVLLLGNHDLSEWQAGKYICSGFSQQTHNYVRQLYQENAHLFQLCFANKHILFSHAGVTRSWWNAYFGNEALFWYNPREIAKLLNGFYKTSFLLPPSREQTEKDFGDLLNMASPKRGGIDAPSLLWADQEDLLEDPFGGFIQVVGHTPVSTIQRLQPDSNKTIIFCDTHSTYPNGDTIGDNSILEIKTKKKQKCENCLQFKKLVL